MHNNILDINNNLIFKQIQYEKLNLVGTHGFVKNGTIKFFISFSYKARVHNEYTLSSFLSNNFYSFYSQMSPTILFKHGLVTTRNGKREEVHKTRLLSDFNVSSTLEMSDTQLFMLAKLIKSFLRDKVKFFNISYRLVNSRLYIKISYFYQLQRSVLGVLNRATTRGKKNSLFRDIVVFSISTNFIQKGSSVLNNNILLGYLNLL
jgi:hypothetical protein